MKIKLSIFLLILTLTVTANAQSFPQSWIGTYEGVVSEMNANQTRSISIWAKMEFGETEGGIYVTYTEGENSDMQNKYILKPKAVGATMSLYFENCMPVEYGSSEPCSSEFKPGDLMFKLVRTRTGIQTIWGKLKKDSPKVFFKKTT
ncbi:MAG: hypothetical protein JNL64_12290 [Blastocatellia bacterium]|jgi:hypothetical protein|nr:hypothetical protein [Blastocatellia bacterium]